MKKKDGILLDNKILTLNVGSIALRNCERCRAHLPMAASTCPICKAGQN